MAAEPGPGIGGGPPPPRANPELVGHRDAAATLVECWRSRRLAHAWLLTGLQGVGKATLAYRFARFVLNGGARGELFGDTANALALDADEPVFRRVAAGSHADLLTVERGFDDKKKRRRDEIVAADVRAVGPFLRFTASEGGWRVVVIDRADDFNLTAANALLKVLEEPPDNSLILLVSNTPGWLLPTIHSRCRRLALRPLDETTVAGFLGRHRPELDTSEAIAIARLAEGSPGHALRLADEGGLALYGEMVKLIEQAPNFVGETLYGLAERVARPGAGPEFATLMELLRQWLARLVRAGATGTVAADVVPGESHVVRRLLAGGRLEHWIDVWEKTGRLAARTDHANLDRRHVVITTFSTLKAAFHA